MKQLAIDVLSGPLLMALLCGLGIPCGYSLGLIASGIVVAVVAVGLGIVLARVTETVTAMLAVVCAMLTGTASAYGFHCLRELDTGAFVRDVPMADLARLHGIDRLTLRDGTPREDFFEIASHTSVWGVGSDRHEVTTSCEAYPIVPEGWTKNDAVPVWRFGDDDQIEGVPIRERVFRPSAPDDLCRKAIDRAIANHRLVVDDHAIYLEAEVSDSPNVFDNRYKGAFAVALLGSLWIGIALYVHARAAIANRESRR